MQITALIPAYNPTEHLVALVHDLKNSVFESIIIVNDGSASSCEKIFDILSGQEGVTILNHPVNKGKGAALKTGLRHIASNHQSADGVILIDADGQHLAKDASNVANALHETPHNLVIGAREFGNEVPFRSRFGNVLTGFLFRLMTGTHLTDTQSGLRAVPRKLIPYLLKIKSNGYEFELDMLIACKHCGISIIQTPIQTIYLDGNKSSHFNPIVDSIKIYFVLFRFTMTSLLSAIIDNIVFILVYGVSSSIPLSQVISRILATTFNYYAVRKRVFLSRNSLATTLPKYLCLVCLSGLASFLAIICLTTYLPFSVVWAKIFAETTIFLVNFMIQRDFIFNNNNPEEVPASVTNQSSSTVK